MSTLQNTSKTALIAPCTPKKTKKIKAGTNKDDLISTFLRVKNNKMNVESGEG